MKTALIILAIIIIIGAAYFALRGSNKSTTPNSQSLNPVETTSVEIKNFDYNPKNILVSAGSEVTFTNHDNVAHTVTADDGSFDSGNIEPGASYKKVFNSAGTFSYYCIPHPYMKGKVEVK